MSESDIRGATAVLIGAIAKEGDLTVDGLAAAQAAVILLESALLSLARMAEALEILARAAPQKGA